jgi:integrase
MKMYKGHRYVISCKALGVPETKEASYQAANIWWGAKKAELDAASLPVTRPPLPLEDLARVLLPDPAILDDPAKAACYLSPCRESQSEPGTEQQPPADYRAAVIRRAIEDVVQRTIFCGNPLPEEMVNQLPQARVQQLQRAAHCFRGELATTSERTIEARAADWLKSQQARVDAGQMTAARCAENRSCLEHFKTFLGPQTDVGSINAQTLQQFYDHCMGRIAVARKGEPEGWSVRRGQDVFAVARSFVRWLVEQGTIDPPRNLTSKGFRFGSHTKQVETWTAAEFKAAVEAAPGKLKLALLLMANCGMTQKDVSDLQDAEVYWKAGRVIRKRSKTATHENVPKVNYKLWPLTFELLKQYRSENPDHVLLTEGGEPFVRTDLKEGSKLSKADGFASNYVHLKRKLQKTLPGFDRPMKELRKLGATLLEGHKDYGRFGSYFLGHSPRTVKDRHYVQPPQELFDEAVTWLGQQLGQVPAEGGKRATGKKTAGR